MASRRSCVRRWAPTRSRARFTCSGPSGHTAHHSAYRLGFARIAYPWHPLYGRRLRVGQRTTRRAADLLLVEERIGVLRELPAWMCDEAACAAMTPGPPAVAIAALNDLTLVLAGLTAKHPSPGADKPLRHTVGLGLADEGKARRHAE